MDKKTREIIIAGMFIIFLLFYLCYCNGPLSDHAYGPPEVQIKMERMIQ